MSPRRLKIANLIAVALRSELLAEVSPLFSVRGKNTFTNHVCEGILSQWAEIVVLKLEGQYSLDVFGFACGDDGGVKHWTSSESVYMNRGIKCTI
jgi:hypothetical protein